MFSQHLHALKVIKTGNGNHKMKQNKEKKFFDINTQLGGLELQLSPKFKFSEFSNERLLLCAFRLSSLQHINDGRNQLSNSKWLPMHGTFSCTSISRQKAIATKTEQFKHVSQVYRKSQNYFYSFLAPCRESHGFTAAQEAQRGVQKPKLFSKQRMCRAF